MRELAGLAVRTRPSDGDSVLWIHGYTLDATSWDDLWEKLPAWNHVGIDLPGHGASRPFTADETLPDLARAIGGAAQGNGIRHLVALSVGTIVALQIAIEYPQAFSAIVLGAPGLGGGPQDNDARRVYERVVRNFQHGGSGAELRQIWMGEDSPLFRGLERGSRRWDRVAAIVDRHTWRELSDGSMFRLTNYVQRYEDLGCIASALLLLVGEQDMLAFRRSAEIIRRAVPSTTRIYLPNVGHLCMLQAPELAAVHVEHHLRTHLTPSSS
jgi:pimeloyl-ACP methyl ester carboxylesterase